MGEEYEGTQEDNGRDYGEDDGKFMTEITSASLLQLNTGNGLWLIMKEVTQCDDDDIEAM